jgi:hypothetical protein
VSFFDVINDPAFEFVLDLLQVNLPSERTRIIGDMFDLYNEAYKKRRDFIYLHGTEQPNKLVKALIVTKLAVFNEPVSKLTFKHMKTQQPPKAPKRKFKADTELPDEEAYIYSEEDLKTANAWLLHAKGISPSFKIRPAHWAECVGHYVKKYGSSHEEILAMLEFVKNDDFWVRNAVSLPNLDKRSKAGLTKFESVRFAMKKKINVNQIAHVSAKYQAPKRDKAGRIYAESLYESKGLECPAELCGVRLTPDLAEIHYPSLDHQQKISFLHKCCRLITNMDNLKRIEQGKPEIEDFRPYYYED